MTDSQSQQNQPQGEQKSSNLVSQLKPSTNAIAEAKKQEENKQTEGHQQNQTQQAVQQTSNQVQKQPEVQQNQTQKHQNEQSKEGAQNTKQNEEKKAAQNQNAQQDHPKAETAKETTTKDQPQKATQVQAKINEETKRKCMEIFIRFQTNGSVEKNILGYAYRALGKVLTEQDIQALINSIKEEKIGFDLFLDKYQAIQSRSQNELFDAFEAMDIEKKGFVSLEILKNILLCEEKQLPAQDVELVLKELANEKGEVNYKELISKVFPSA